MTLDTSNCENKFEVKSSKLTGIVNIKIVFCAYISEKWIDLHQTKTKMILGPFYSYRRIHFTTELL